MPIYDFECEKCNKITEHILKVSNSEQAIQCECGGLADKIITASGQFCANEDADWIRSIREVVDKEGGKASQRFLKEPTRENYKKWKKETGVRHLEPGEGPSKPEPMDMDKMTKDVMRRRQERKQLIIN